MNKEKTIKYLENIKKRGENLKKKFEMECELPEEFIPCAIDFLKKSGKVADNKTKQRTEQ